MSRHLTVTILTKFGRCLVPTTAAISTILIEVVHGMPQSLEANTRIVPRFDYDSFLQNTLQFIVLLFDAISYLQPRKVMHVRAREI
jgi:hypothetical protein